MILPEQRAPGAPPTSREGANTVALVVLCQVAHFLTFTAIPLLLPAIREDFEIGFTEAGMLAAAGALSYAGAQIPAGYLADHYGPRRLPFYFWLPSFLIADRGFTLAAAGLVMAMSAALRDAAGSFASGFRGISVACLAGVALAVVLARMRARALRAARF